MDPVEALAAARHDGRRVALVTVVAVDGDVPAEAGAKLVADVEGPIAGGLGCSEFDTAGRALAAEVLGGGVPVRRRVAYGSHDDRAVELFAEVVEPPPAVVVVGANPIGEAIAAIAGVAGWRVEVLDAAPADALRARPPSRRDAVVVTDHDAPWVDDVLELALTGEAAFVGMLGSRRHVPRTVAQLRGRGVAGAAIARLHSPCGLDIGSRTPGEIGLSIVGEIVADAHGRPGGPLRVDWSATDDPA